MIGNEYADGMLEHDGDVGKLLKTLDDLKIADNTIVVYTTDNGPNQWSWPDAATTPFRNEKNSNWEGAYRVPAMVRWPARSRPTRSPPRCSRAGLVPDAARGCRRHDIKDRLLKGADVGGKNFKVHLDGYNQLDYLTGKTDKSARDEFYYFNDDGDWWPCASEGRLLRAARAGWFQVWSEPFTCLRVPKLFNLRMDPYERADVVSDQYYDWLTKNDLIFKGTRKPRNSCKPSSSTHPASGRQLQHRPDPGRCEQEDRREDERQMTR
jgi:arylsulfatase